VQVKANFPEFDRSTTVVNNLYAHRQQSGQVQVGFKEFLTLFVGKQRRGAK